MDNTLTARLSAAGLPGMGDGLLETVREDIKDGKVILLPDECRVFVKHL